jgi:hypothetical protein
VRANCVLCGFVRAEPRAPNPCVCLLTHRLAFQRHPSLPYATKSKIPVEEIVRAQRPPRATSRTGHPNQLYYYTVLCHDVKYYDASRGPAMALIYEQKTHTSPPPIHTLFRPEKPF